MRALVVGDIHWSQTSSIVRRRGQAYSKRLENCINSVNWVEEKAEELKVDKIIYLGDFFDRAELNAEEVTALSEIYWADIPHTIIVGNHELGNASADYSTARLLLLLPNFEVISKPELEVGFGYRILYLPYIFERDRKPLADYFKECEKANYFETQEVKSTIIISHNDIKGVNYGMFESQEGFELGDIKKSRSLFLNGHIHNGQEVAGGVINVGNLTGQNFNEDATKYDHHIVLLDTNYANTISNTHVEYIENPYAYNFYKLDISEMSQISKLKFKSHSVVSVRCLESLVSTLRERLDSDENIEEYRLITVAEDVDTPEGEMEPVEQLTSVDHLEQFQKYILETLGSSEYVLKELQEVVANASQV